MYKIKNGILEENGKKIFAVGESYYPSFYPYKYPVPPEGDRVGEMKKDFAMMKSLGFNYVRIAAIGTVKLSEDGSLAVDTPFVEKLLKEAERVGLSISVRLQGYSVKLRDFKDVCMIDADSKPQDLSVCYDFIQTTLCHGGKFWRTTDFCRKNSPSTMQNTRALRDFRFTTNRSFRVWKFSTTTPPPLPHTANGLLRTAKLARRRRKPMNRRTQERNSLPRCGRCGACSRRRAFRTFWTTHLFRQRRREGGS